MFNLNVLDIPGLIGKSAVSTASVLSGTVTGAASNIFQGITTSGSAASRIASGYINASNKIYGGFLGETTARNLIMSNMLGTDPGQYYTDQNYAQDPGLLANASSNFINALNLTPRAIFGNALKAQLLFTSLPRVAKLLRGESVRGSVIPLGLRSIVHGFKKNRGPVAGFLKRFSYGMALGSAGLGSFGSGLTVGGIFGGFGKKGGREINRANLFPRLVNRLFKKDIIPEKEIKRVTSPGVLSEGIAGVFGFKRGDIEEGLRKVSKMPAFDMGSGISGNVESATLSDYWKSGISDKGTEYTTRIHEFNFKGGNISNVRPYMSENIPDFFENEIYDEFADPRKVRKYRKSTRKQNIASAKVKVDTDAIQSYSSRFEAKIQAHTRLQFENSRGNFRNLSAKDSFELFEKYKKSSTKRISKYYKKRLREANKSRKYGIKAAKRSFVSIPNRGFSQELFNQISEEDFIDNSYIKVGDQPVKTGIPEIGKLNYLAGAAYDFDKRLDRAVFGKSRGFISRSKGILGFAGFFRRVTQDGFLEKYVHEYEQLQDASKSIRKNVSELDKKITTNIKGVRFSDEQVLNVAATINDDDMYHALKSSNAERYGKLSSEEKLIFKKRYVRHKIFNKGIDEINIKTPKVSNILAKDAHSKVYGKVAMSGLSYVPGILRTREILKYIGKGVNTVVNATLANVQTTTKIASNLGRMEFGSGHTLETSMASTERSRAISAMQNIGLSARSYLGQEARIMSQV